FVLAGFVGYQIITKVPALLHTPLMSATNAISGISLVGSLVAAGAQHSGYSTFLGFIAVTAATINVVGGFMITDRMLKMFKRYERYWPLADRTLVMIFEKASTRTRLSFEAGMQQLGGFAIYFNTRDSQLGRGESVEDAAEVISRMCDVVMIRTFEQDIIERFARHSRVPVINGLTNEYHPCQILADIYTYVEQRGSIRGRTVAWIGDSNNVCNTWLQAAEIFDFTVHVSTPPKYEVEPERAGLYGTDHYEQFADPMAAARDADLVTTDVWTSMGFEAENDARRRDFHDWQVTRK
ncbi:MAG: ornithine carbamoyltransferase, partial [Gammaproteobacteria bacterium]|nr:ornithine carbamoyltransferase [Gammaproteobacteria bacterium]